MKFGIIAAGEGLRFKEAGIQTPKPLIKINNISLIERAFIVASFAGFESINIIINKSNKSFRSLLEQYSIKYSIQLNLIIRTTPSSFHSFFELGKYLDGSDFCFTTIDSIYSPYEFRNYINSCKSNKSSGLLAVTNFVDDEKPLWVTINDKNNITAFSDTMEQNTYVTGGIYYFKNGVYKFADNAMDLKIERLRNFLRFLIENNLTLDAFRFSKIIDVDREQDIVTAEEYLKEESHIGN